MASTGKKGKKSKGRTLNLNEFLGDGPPLPPPAPRKTNWSDDVDDFEPSPSLHLHLPTAPRAARGPDFDEARIPENGPFVAYISNLLYDVEEKDISDFFEGLNVSKVRLPRDDRNGKQKGFGYVEFGDRSSFLNALQIPDTQIKGRRIRIEIADSSDNNSNRRGGGMQYRDRERDSNYDPERTEGDWRAGPRPDLAEERRGPRRDMGGGGGGGGFRDSQDRDRGSSFSETGNWRDAPRRPPPDDRDERDSSRSFGPRRNFGDRDRMRNGSPTSERPIGARPKLDLKPRTLPIEPIQVHEDISVKEEESSAPRPILPKPSAASIFGGAKPVDTAAREREIEARLAKDRQAEPDAPRSRGETSEKEKGPVRSEDDKSVPPVENAWARRTPRTEEPQPTDGEKPSQLDTKENTEKDTQREKSRERERYQPPRDRDRDPYRDSDRNRGTYRDSDRDRGQRVNDGDRDRSSRDNDRGYGRDWDRDRHRESDRYRDSDRDRNRDNDRYRDSDRDRNRDNDRYRDSDRYRDPDRDRYRDSDRDRDRYRDSDRDRYRESDRDRDRYKESDRVRGREADKDNRDDDDRKESKADNRPREDKEQETGGSRTATKTQDSKTTSKEPKLPKDAKIQEPEAPNYVAPNKYSFLEEDADASE